MRLGIGAILAIGLSASGAMAQTQSDAERIVEVTMSDELFDAVADTMTFSVVSALQNEVAKTGGSLSDQAADNLAEMMVDAMLPKLTSGLKEESAAIYEDLLSPGTLKAYRQFLDTPEGQELAAQTPIIMRESEKLGQQIGVEIVPDVLEAIDERIKADNWPEGTLPSSKREIRKVLEN